MLDSEVVDSLIELHRRVRELLYQRTVVLSALQRLYNYTSAILEKYEQV